MGRQAIILGSESDIAKGLTPFLLADGWRVHGWSRSSLAEDWPEWDLVINCLGRIAPVGYWEWQDDDEWDDCMYSNLLLPRRLLRSLWEGRNNGAAVCFLAGSNPNMIMDGYCAYNVAKMAVLKLVEQVNHESPDTTVFALAPGIVMTKIHGQSTGWHNPKLEAVRNGAVTAVSIERVYRALLWCLSQPKGVVGGRNVCASDLSIDNDNDVLARRLVCQPNLFKLRRQE
jgi:NAD(P)-dependent dehydrogenase (short-subunit alcohol dehydrogenase family)